MRAQRIKTGFHRLGLALAGTCVGVVALNAVFGWKTPDPSPWATGYDLWFFAWLTGAITAYPVCWMIGWIAAGFAGDDDSQTSN